MGLSDDDLLVLENVLLQNPKTGNVIVGTGGARKIRIQLDTGRGKSSGGRVIYVDIIEKERFFCSPTQRISRLTSPVTKGKQSEKSLIKSKWSNNGRTQLQNKNDQ